MGKTLLVMEENPAEKLDTRPWEKKNFPKDTKW